jgi:XRE family aerobic/anaerobic benzoate catabolism transcriptional regulator
MIRMNRNMQYISDMQADAPKDPISTEILSSQIAKRIRAARARAGLTRKQLAASSGASERYLALLESGTGNPSVEMLLSISESLGIAMADLLPLGGERDATVAAAAQYLRRMAPERLQEVLRLINDAPEEVEGKGRRIALIGLRGAGKTSLGKSLAERRGVPFFEVSKEVERLYGGSIGVLLEMSGPSVLHRYEGQVLREIQRDCDAAVIAAPGAIVANPKLYEQLLGSAWTVWLQATPEDHMERVVGQGDLRPMSGNRSAMNDLKRILAAREQEYARADIALDTSAQGFESTIDLLEREANSIMT